MANSGIKTVLTLRKYVNGVATDETKANVDTDPDYIAPYEDLVDCPIGVDPTTTTTTTSTTTSTTTTTTQQQNFTNQTISANCSSDTGGVYIIGGITYTINAQKEFYVPVGVTVDFALTASFTAGPGAVSCYGRIETLTGSTVWSGGGIVEASTGNPVDQNTGNAILAPGNYRMRIYGASCDDYTFGSFSLTITEQ